MLLHKSNGLCACRDKCGDVPERDDPDSTCKGLPAIPSPPLLEVVLVRRAR